MSPDRAHELCVEIGQVVKAAAPDGWRYVDVHRWQVGAFSTTVIAYQMADESRRIQSVAGLDGLFHQLKAAEHRQGEGTWFACQLGYSPRGKSYNSMLHTFALETPFAQDVEVPASAYVEELTMFPRRPTHTPPWLVAAWTDDSPSPEISPSPPPSAQEENGLTRPPLRSMIARTIGRDDDPDLIMLGMAENEDGTGNALIFMMSTEEQEAGPGMDTYCIVREDQAGTTYGGVTRCELAARRLTLHFTEKAAKDLDIEPVLPIDLHVDDDSIELLRRSLRKILLSGPNDQHPRPIHL